MGLNCRELSGEQLDSGGKAVIEGGEHCWFGKGIGIHVGGVKRRGVAVVCGWSILSLLKWRLPRDDWGAEKPPETGEIEVWC